MDQFPSVLASVALPKSNPMNFWRSLILCFLATIPAGCGSSESLVNDADPQHANEPLPSLPAPDVNTLLNEMAAVYTKAQSVKVTGSLTQVVLDPRGRPISDMSSPPKQRTFTLKKPNLVSVVAADDAGPRLASDGKDLVVYVPFLGGHYVREPAPASPFGVIGDSELLMLGGPPFFFPINFAAENFDDVIRSFSKRTYLGADRVAGAPAHHLLLELNEPSASAGGGVQLWIAAEGQPVILRAQFDMGVQSIDVGRKEKESHPTAVIDEYSDYQFDSPTDDSTWAIKLPEAAAEVTSFTLAPLSSYGEPAPAFEGKTLKDETVSLAQYAGKNVVLLSFWTAESQVSIGGVAVADQLHKEFGDKGLATLAINPNDSKEAIEKFFTQHQPETTVVVDSSQAIATAYDLSAMPTLVLIDREGNLQAVHMGLQATIGGAIRREIEALLAGQSLKQPRIPKQNSLPQTPQ